MGARTRATQPRRVPVQFTPRALNMYMLKRGKTPPAMDRRKVFAAIAEAALKIGVSDESLVAKGIRGKSLDCW